MFTPFQQIVSPPPLYVKSSSVSFPCLPPTPPFVHRSSCYYLLDSALIHTRELAAADDRTDTGGTAVRRSPPGDAPPPHPDPLGPLSPSGSLGQPGQPVRPAPPVPLGSADMADGKQELVSRFLDSLPAHRWDSEGEGRGGNSGHQTSWEAEILWLWRWMPKCVCRWNSLKGTAGKTGGSSLKLLLSNLD